MNSLIILKVVPPGIESINFSIFWTPWNYWKITL